MHPDTDVNISEALHNVETLLNICQTNDYLQNQSRLALQAGPACRRRLGIQARVGLTARFSVGLQERKACETYRVILEHMVVHRFAVEILTSA
jgi:hypothetical protein